MITCRQTDFGGFIKNFLIAKCVSSFVKMSILKLFLDNNLIRLISKLKSF